MLLASLVASAVAACDRTTADRARADAPDSAAITAAAVAKTKAESAAAHCIMAREDSSAHIGEARVNAICATSDTLAASAARAVQDTAQRR